MTNHLFNIINKIKIGYKAYSDLKNGRCKCSQCGKIFYLSWNTFKRVYVLYLSPNKYYGLCCGDSIGCMGRYLGERAIDRIEEQLVIALSNNYKF